MEPFLFVVTMKPGMLKSYREFAAEITGPRKHEYSGMLKRFGLKNVKVWHKNIGGTEYAFVYHDKESSAEEKLKHWASSTDPFVVWFRDQLDKHYESGSLEKADFVFGFESIRSLQ